MTLFVNGNDVCIYHSMPSIHINRCGLQWLLAKEGFQGEKLEESVVRTADRWHTVLCVRYRCLWFVCVVYMHVCLCPLHICSFVHLIDGGVDENNIHIVC